MPHASRAVIAVEGGGSYDAGMRRGASGPASYVEEPMRYQTTINRGFRLITLAVLGLAGWGGWACQKDVGASDEAEIDLPTLVENRPHAPRPATYFPGDLQVDDVKVNQFINRMLKVCEEGDYDGFRQRFGIAYAPPDRVKFENIWHGVREIRIEDLRAAPSDPPVYYLYVVVKLRKPDSEGRMERPIVVMLFQETDEWRMGPASKEIVRKFLAAASRPARQGRTRPADP